ncbi:acyclic terpene utilization AtuA family protein [Actinomadura atramentaria]|uniref:acyclic terpene utilization AtuA family protein n=1 Tax=Actinomadura atramentaria TaxID=1990 RepID=UPI0003652AAF|nr:acyclic terpene utilization AtuA family protein [Actinomadura atramentaria]
MNARGTRPVRVANCSGFYGDRASALAEVVRGGPVDVVTGDYLAEVTMLVLAKARLKDPDAGYARTFLAQLDPVLEEIAERGIKVVVNAGGLNPAGLAAATRELLARRGVDLAVAYVDGDDVTGRTDLVHLRTGAPLAAWGHEPLTANAYLGGFGVARALAGGADVVVTGRVADASVVSGAAAWWWDWTPADLDALAGAVAAGHVIECGTQATGGNFSGFRDVPGLERPGFPLAEIDADGAAVITKHPGTGGAVTRDTVTAQLLYEIGDPAYLNPDVVAHLDALALDDLGGDRVRISGTRGSAPPATTKVAVTALGGWRNSGTFLLTGLDADAKADLVERTVRARLADVPGITDLTFTGLGVPAADPATQGDGTRLLHVAAQGTEKAAGRAFSGMLVEMALATYPGCHSMAPPGRGGSYGLYWPGLVGQASLRHRVVHADGREETVPAPVPGPVPATAAAEPPPVPAGPTVRVPLGRIAHARSGDKGGDANVGVWTSAAAYDWLRAALTVAELRRLLPEAAELDIERHELPRLNAVNFLIRGLLDEGATSTSRFDKQAKALGEWLRARVLDVPERLLPGADRDIGDRPLR